jgi:hypothetical protein
MSRPVLNRICSIACINMLVVLMAWVLSRPGKGASDFKTRTELFIGPGHDDAVGRIYADRSSVEHLHEDRLLEPFERAKRLELVNGIARSP